MRASIPSPDTARLARRAVLSAIALVVAFLAAAPLYYVLTKKSAVTTAPQKAETDSPAAENLALALDSLRKLAEGAEDQPVKRTIFYLNQWLTSYEPAKAPWKPDRLLDNLPRALRSTPGLETLGKLHFTRDDKRNDAAYLQQMRTPHDDISYLQQALWLHDIAQRVGRQPPPAELKAWLKSIETTVGLPEAEQIATAERLFDWTIRNVQLDALPPPPKGPLATAGSGSEPVAPAALGELGPGYGHLSVEVLLYGHGDAHERARVFILLCRQVGIDAVMLGLPEENSESLRGWTAAVFVGGKLYLFETSLALPIPGPDGQGIATLDQVAADSKLLRQLDVEGLPPYPVTAKDLKGVVALIDAEPAALSRRMQLLQSALPSAMRLALATQPSELASKLPKIFSGVRLWRIPMEAVLYPAGYQQVLARDPQAALELRKLNAIFASARPMMKARNLHLQGRFENEDNKLGARSLYLECRPPENEMIALQNSDYFRTSVGLQQTLPADPQQRKAILEYMDAIARGGKFNATYWLGLTYYESGRYAPAIEWLGERTVQVAPPSPWTAGARYNLARCYEQLGQYDLARQWLQSDQDSPQRHGNLLRAKWLEAKHPSKSTTNTQGDSKSSP